MIFPEGNSHPPLCSWHYILAVRHFNTGIVWEFAAEYVMPETLVMLRKTVFYGGDGEITPLVISIPSLIQLKQALFNIRPKWLLSCLSHVAHIENKKV